MILYGNTDENLTTELAEINNRLETIEKDGTGIFEEGFSIVGQYSKTLPDALEIGLYTGTAAGVAGAVLGPGSVFTAKGGFIVGFLGSMAFDSFAIEGGSMYLDLVEEKMDDQTAKKIGEDKVFEFRRSWDIKPEKLNRDSSYHPLNLSLIHI